MFGTATNQALDAQLKKAGLMNWRDVAKDLVPGDLLFFSGPYPTSALGVVQYHTMGLVICNFARPWDGSGPQRGTVTFIIYSSTYGRLSGKHVSREWNKGDTNEYVRVN